MTYKDELTRAMTYIGEQENSVFMGQSVAFPGTSLYGTLTNVSKHKLIEFPVLEETQTGVALGMSLTDKCVVSIYPRWDFLISAAMKSRSLLCSPRGIPNPSHVKLQPNVRKKTDGTPM